MNLSQRFSLVVSHIAPPWKFRRLNAHVRFEHRQRCDGYAAIGYTYAIFTNQSLALIDKLGSFHLISRSISYLKHYNHFEFWHISMNVLPRFCFTEPVIMVHLKVLLVTILELACLVPVITPLNFSLGPEALATRSYFYIGGEYVDVCICRCLSQHAHQKF